MKYLLLSAALLVFICKLSAQPSVAYIDSTIIKLESKNSRFGKIKRDIPTKRKVFIYHKSNRKMFHIWVRNHWALDKPDTDTMTLTNYYFIEDRLAGIKIELVIDSRLKNWKKFYFDNDKLFAESGELNYTPAEIPAMIAKAYELLAEGNFLIEQKFTNP